jgi:23S rRNA pseudouridine1911/1915/1917 synthase
MNTGVKRHYSTFPEFGPEPECLTIEELKSLILFENEHLLVLDKPGWIVCHPSKNGPFSSLVGAAREYCNVETLHLVFRLDRETSGVVVLAKNRKYARICQMAIEKRDEVQKEYYVILEGELPMYTYVNQHLARDMESPVYVKMTVRKSNSSQSARTHFVPVFARNGYTLVRIVLETGRKHQIRAHAEWLKHKVVGDKVYGPDASLFLEFAEHGWTPRLQQMLPMRRQALHAGNITFNTPEYHQTFTAPLAWDMEQFCCEKMGIMSNDIKVALAKPLDCKVSFA